MNRIRYRQWIRDCYPAGVLRKAHWEEWGFVGAGGHFMRPHFLDMSYPESFQSTGQYAKTKAEVWRGSIIKYNDIVCVVIWDKNRYCWSVRAISVGNANSWSVGSIEMLHQLVLTEWSVIGNTTENPDWKEVGK